MAAQITQTLTAPPTAPSRSQDPTTFNTNVDARLEWDGDNVTEMTTWQGQANTLSTEVNANAVAAESSANDAATSETNAAASEAAAAASAAFKGLWSSLSGALNMPASVIHNNVIWLLNTNSANVAADEPGVSSKWSILRPTNINLAREMGGTAYQNIAGFPLPPSFEIKTYDYINEVNGFHPQATVSRASTATYPDEKGVLRTASADVLRHWWNPATGEYRGVIVEGASTNLCTHSQEFDNAGIWAVVNLNVTANAVVAPDSTTTADKLYVSTATGEHYIQDNCTASAGTHVASVFVKAAEYNHFRFLIVHNGESSVTSALLFDLDSGPTQTTNALITDGGMEDYGNGWRRCWVKYTLTAAATNNYIRIQLLQTIGGGPTFTGDGVSGIYAWGATIEKNTEMTSYIPTSGATATRALDSVWFSGSDFSDWYNATEGTFIVSSSLARVPTVDAKFLDVGSTANDRFTFMYTSAGSTAIKIFTAGPNIFNSAPTGATTLTVNQKITVGMTYKSSDFASAGLGGNLTTSSSGAVPTVDRLNIGMAFTGLEQINGFVSYIAYFPRQISDSLLQVSTS